MSFDPETERHLQDAYAALRRAVESAQKHAVSIERDRMRKFVDGEIDAAPVEQPQPTKQPQPVKDTPGQTAAEYGGITNPVRKALAILGQKNGPAGVTPEDVTTYCTRALGANITVGQVRTSLKVLAKRSEATRLERGVYGPGPKLDIPGLSIAEQLQ